MGIITLGELNAKREEVDALWQAANAAKIAAAKAEEEYKNMRYEYFCSQRGESCVQIL